MAVREDPEQNEDRVLARLIPSFTGHRVLEIGAGDGRITRKFAGLAASAIAIDPKTEEIARLRSELPSIDARAIGIHELQLPPHSVDVAIFSWAL
jgi:ubiquinone/menaquinone biosynthesis C-methylase UbiE